MNNTEQNQISPKRKITWSWDWNTGILEIEIWYEGKVAVQSTLTGQKAWDIHEMLRKLDHKV